MNTRSLFTLLFVAIFATFFHSATAQTLTYDTHILPEVPLGATVKMSEVKEDFAPRLVHLESPSPGGDSYRSFLKRQKEISSTLYPRKESAPSAQRPSGQQPLIGRAFHGNFDNRGIPLDTHLGISAGGQVVSAINGDVLVKDSDGNALFGVSLDAFFNPLGLENAPPFDPKVHYDPGADRWMIFALGRNQANRVSRIFIGFSETNDATGNWNLYKLDGNPLVTNTWIDYPMISISEYEVYLTGNSVRWNEPWQTGFDQTMIWQLNKRDGYAGNMLGSRVWSNIMLGGLTLRNLCPVKGGAGNYGPNHFFLSNRNFDVQNNAIFILELTDTINAPGANIRLDVRATDVAYGLAPSARQAGPNTLATNDSRILDAFFWNDKIQFVGNTIDTATGRPAVYHGFIDDVSTNKIVTGHIISDDSLDLGYPSIAYMGSSDVSWEEEDALIFFDTSSPQHPASTASVYYDNQGNHSEILRTRSGVGPINVLLGNDERWGDYTGCQRKYDEPGAVWTMGTLGRSDQTATTWINEFFRPGPPASIKKPKPNIQLTAFPVPAREFLQVEFEIPKGESITIDLFNSAGQLVRSFFDDIPKASGKARFSFDTRPLAAGMYVLRVSGEDGVLAMKKVVIGE